jgi:hypothetical protein
MSWAQAGAPPVAAANPSRPTAAALGPAAQAVASTAVAWSAAEQKAMIQVLMRSRLSANETLVVLALGGASQESLQEIHSELQQRGVDAAKSHQIAVDRNDRLTIDGRDSGVKIRSYSPLQANYKGALWSYDRSVAADANFKALVSAFGGSQASAASLLLLPFAQAKAPSTSFDFLILGVALLAAGVVLKVPPISSLGNVSLLAAIIAFMRSGWSADKNKKDLLSSLPPSAACDDNFATIYWGNMEKLSIDKKKNEIARFDDRGRVDTKLTSLESDALLKVAASCKNSQDERKFRDDFARAVSQAMTIAQKGAAAKAPGDGSPKPNSAEGSRPGS